MKREPTGAELLEASERLMSHSVPFVRMHHAPNYDVRVGVTGRALHSFRAALRDHYHSERPADVHVLLWKAQRESMIDDQGVRRAGRDLLVGVLASRI